MLLLGCGPPAGCRTLSAQVFTVRVTVAGTDCGEGNSEDEGEAAKRHRNLLGARGLSGSLASLVRGRVQEVLANIT